MPVYRIAPLVFWGAGFSAFFCVGMAAALCRRFGGRPVRISRMLFLLLFGGYLFLVPALTLFPIRFDPKVGVLHLPWRNGIVPAAANAHNAERPFATCIRNAILLLPFGFLLPISGKYLHNFLPCLGIALLYAGAIGIARLAEYSAGLVPYGCSAEEWLFGFAGAGFGFALWRSVKCFWRGRLKRADI